MCQVSVESLHPHQIVQKWQFLNFPQKQFLADGLRQAHEVQTIADSIEVIADILHFRWLDLSRVSNPNEIALWVVVNLKRKSFTVREAEQR